MSKIIDTIGEVTDSTTTASDHLDNTVNYIYNYDQLVNGIEEYYSAKSANNSETIADAQVQIFSSLFGFGTIIPDEWGGWLGDIYNDVFNVSVDIVGKEAEKNRIITKMNALAPYLSKSEYYEEYCYYDSILNNFDEYYEKKKALKECLTASDSATAIELFYESYEKNKDPFGKFLDEWGEFWTQRGSDLHNILNYNNWKSGMNKIQSWIGNLLKNNMQNCVSEINNASSIKVDPLILDLDKNGSIDNGAELFGDNTVLTDGKLAKNGFEALALN